MVSNVSIVANSLPMHVNIAFGRWDIATDVYELVN